MFFLLVLLILAIDAKAQYQKMTISKSDNSALKIVQIDYREFSTIVHFQYTSRGTCYVCLNDGIFIQNDTNMEQKFHLLNSFNMPLCDNKVYLDRGGLDHNFSLEFEKIPPSVNKFSILGSPVGGANFYNIEIDTLVKENNFLDITTFVNNTPAMEYGMIYKDGSPISYYTHKGITVAVLLSVDNTYGNYYQANILIQNLSGKKFNFDPRMIQAKMTKSKVTSNLKVYTFDEYISRVNNRQMWNAAAISFSENLAASNAGYSSSSTHTTIHGNSTSFGSAYGYYGNTYCTSYGSSYSYGSAYIKSNSTTYNGSDAYMAQQNANANVANYQMQQYQIKQSLSEGYLKLNTIMNETEYLGYVKIAYKKADNLQITIPVNGINFIFNW